MAHSDVIPEWGGYLEYGDYWGRRWTWVAYTNYPRPYWNEWAVFFEQGARADGPFEVLVVRRVGGDDGKRWPLRFVCRCERYDMILVSQEILCMGDAFFHF